MRFAVVVATCLISAIMLSNVSAQGSACRIIRAKGPSFLEECGDKIRSFALILSESKLGVSGVRREAQGDIHGRFSFDCPVEPMCGSEPKFGGFFISPGSWLKSSKDEQAIYRALKSVPLMATSWSFGGASPPMPSVACPVFDVSIGGMPGRAVCFDRVNSTSAMIAIVAADDHAGFMLAFYQNDMPALALKNKVLELLPRFKIERASGEVGLEEWLK